MNGEIKDSKTQTIILKADKYFEGQKEGNKWKQWKNLSQYFLQ
jgi:hypothetical protein